jgi:hypothetical protein
MTTPLEQRKDLFEIGTDLDLMVSLRKSILGKYPRAWVLIHHNHLTGNYGLEVTNYMGSRYPADQEEEMKKFVSSCKGKPVTDIAPKRTRKKKDLS